MSTGLTTFPYARMTLFVFVTSIARLKQDGSIRPWPGGCAAELVSPVLRGEAGLENIAQAMTVVRGYKPGVNESMGLHVHVSDRKKT